VTEKEIRTEYLENIKFLSMYRQSGIDIILAQAITERFGQQDQLTPQQLIMNDDQEMSACLPHTLWSMLACKILKCDLQNKICMTTILWKNQN
jgi:hypothetical protein